MVEHSGPHSGKIAMANRTYKGCVYRATLIRTGMAYIGKSLAGLKTRRYVHYWHARNGLKTPFAHALNAYIDEAFIWEELFCSDDDALLKAVEIEQIAAHKARGVKLYNISAGGDGYNGAKWTEERRQRQMRMIDDRRKLGLLTHTPETRKTLSEKATGRKGPKMTAAGLVVISETKKAYWANFTPEQRSELARKSALGIKHRQT